MTFVRLPLERNGMCGRCFAGGIKQTRAKASGIEMLRLLEHSLMKGICVICVGAYEVGNMRKNGQTMLAQCPVSISNRRPQRDV